MIMLVLKQSILLKKLTTNKAMEDKNLKLIMSKNRISQGRFYQYQTKENLIITVKD